MENQDVTTETPSRKLAGARSSQGADRLLLAIIGVLVLAVIGVGAAFGYTVWQTRTLSEQATPALRVVRELEQGARDEPNSAAIRVRLGEAYAAAGMSKEAIDSLKNAIKIDEKHVGAYLDLGQVYLNLGEFEQAQSAFEKIVELTAGKDQDANRTREQALYYLGQLSLAGKDYEQAVGYLKSALRIRADASDSYLNLALAYRGLGENDAAMSNLLIALKFDPGLAHARFVLGQLYNEQGKKGEAAAQFRAAVDYAPGVQDYKEELDKFGSAGEYMAASEKAYQAKNWSGAIAQAMIARAVDPKNVDAVRAHAKALDAAKKSKAALAAYEDLLALVPADKEAKAAVARLKESK